MITANYGGSFTNEAAGAGVSCQRHQPLRFQVLGSGQRKLWHLGNDTNVNSHDPFTYARAAQYITQMKAADPTIKIGVPVVTGEDNNATVTWLIQPSTPAPALNNGWTPRVLATLKSLGVRPDFSFITFIPSIRTTAMPHCFRLRNRAADAANLRQQITDYFGVTERNIEILCTENNSDAGNQGRQSTSIVNGLTSPIVLRS